MSAVNLPDWFKEEFFEGINSWFSDLARNLSLERVVLSSAAKTTLENALLAYVLYYNRNLNSKQASKGLKLLLAYASLLVLERGTYRITPNDCFEAWEQILRKYVLSRRGYKATPWPDQLPDIDFDSLADDEIYLIVRKYLVSKEVIFEKLNLI